MENRIVAGQALHGHDNYTEMKAPIDVSRGQQLDFAANGSPVSGFIVGSQSIAGPWASVTVETDASIPENAQLTIPDIDCGGCGAAHPISSKNGRVRVEISIPYGVTQMQTIGK